MECPACKEIREEYFSGDPPDCAVCGGPRTITYQFWGQERERKVDGFTVIELGGETFSTREEWEGYRKTWKETHGEDLEVSGCSPRQKKAMIEEHVHKMIKTIEAQGKRRGEDYSNRIKHLQECI